MFERTHRQLKSALPARLLVLSGLSVYPGCFSALKRHLKKRAAPPHLLSRAGFRDAADPARPAPDGARDPGGGGGGVIEGCATSPHEAALLWGGTLWPPAATGSQVCVHAQWRSGSSLVSPLPGPLTSPGEEPDIFEPRGRRPNRGRWCGQERPPSDPAAPTGGGGGLWRRESMKQL
jgi:hypothetical protein